MWTLPQEVIIACQSKFGSASYSQVEQSSTPPPVAIKRDLPDPEDIPSPERKRQKNSEDLSTYDGTRETSTTSTASQRDRRERQSDAPNVAGEKASRISHEPDAKRGSSSMVLVLFRESQPAGGMHVIPELQTARCLSTRYKHEPLTRCVSCTRRGAGDTCRFQGIRYIIRDFERHRFIGISFNEQADAGEACKALFPSRWNRQLDHEHTQRSKMSIARALLPTLKTEQEHIASAHEIIRRQRETSVRVTCDTCMTSLFSTSFMCRRCGRELCHECFQIVVGLTQPDGAPVEGPRRKNTQEKSTRPNASFLSCSKRNAPHVFSEFAPVTRFAQSELDLTIEEMGRILDNDERIEIGSQASSQTKDQIDSEHPSAAFPDPITSPIYDDFTPPNTPIHVTSIPIHRAQIISASLYDPWSSNGLAFSDLWEKGLPLLAKDILPRFKLTWNPEYFVDKYGDQSCSIVECQTDLIRNMCVREFFEQFGKYENRSECWKLKDWPPTTDFQHTFPELFEDFSNAVPVPDYVRRDGVYNIASHFPCNALGPDLGPKMYNSMASSQEAGSQGSTRLHMDMADAFNVMLYASDCADGSAGYAVWDLFHAEDSDRIRDFLRKKFISGSNPETQTTSQIIAYHDPIHIQRFYLDVELRRQLWEEYGVKSFRIYQRPGEGVFIPAGCAHQVANMSDCMKIAIDFVSPENIDRCEKLTKEFREQNQRKAWKEDVLQLRTMMWFAWQSCSKRELELRKEASGGSAVVSEHIMD